MSSHPEVFHGHCRSNIDVESDKQLNVLSSHIPAHHLVLMFAACDAVSRQVQGLASLASLAGLFLVLAWPKAGPWPRR